MTQGRSRINGDGEVTVRFALGLFVVLVLAWTLPPPRVQAESPPAKPAAKRSRSKLARLGRHLAKIVHEGDSTLYASGYAYHKRTVYPPPIMKILHEEAWGGGFGKTLTLADGGVASVAFTAFLDSLGQWEYNLGYMREWRWAPFHGRLHLGVGLTAFVTSRPDFFRGTPVPAVLPQLTLEHGDVALIATLIPRIPDINASLPGVVNMNGDIAYLFARIRLH